jgi:hypothetical protein
MGSVPLKEYRPIYSYKQTRKCEFINSIHCFLSIFFSDTYEMAEALSDSFSSDVMLSDIPDKERLFTLSDSRIKRRTKRFYDEPGNDDAEKGL